MVLLHNKQSIMHHFSALNAEINMRKAHLLLMKGEIFMKDFKCECRTLKNCAILLPIIADTLQ